HRLASEGAIAERRGTHQGETRQDDQKWPAHVAHVEAKPLGGEIQRADADQHDACRRSTPRVGLIHVFGRRHADTVTPALAPRPRHPVDCYLATRRAPTLAEITAFADPSLVPLFDLPADQPRSP